MAANVLFHAGDRLYGVAPGTFDLVECAACGLIRLSPWPSPEQIRGFYPTGYWYQPSAGAASRLEELYRRFVLSDHVRFVRRALKRAGAPGLVLDAGCGGGLFPRLMREEGWRVLGLDSSVEAASVAWHTNSVPTFCADLTAAPLPPESCMAITMFHVLEHLPEPSAYLLRAHELLRPQGRLVVQVPNVSCWQFLLLGEHWNGLDVPRHLIDFRRRDLEAMLERAGFAIEARKHFSLRDNPAGLATSLVPSLDPMARRLRQAAESARARLLRDLLYFALVLASVPFTVVEAACGAGSTIMIEASKR